MRDSIAVVGRWDEHICVAVSLGGDKGGRHTKSNSSGNRKLGNYTTHVIYLVSYGTSCHYGNVSDHTSYESNDQILSWMMDEFIHSPKLLLFLVSNL
jgi:hypothetical protein